MESTDCPRGASSYIWRAGDTLMAVALRYGVPEQSIRQANTEVDFDRVEPSSVICVPQRMLACSDGVLHPVRAGDTIDSIARSHGVTALQIMERNPYVDPTELQPGMLLCVPNRTEVTPPSPTPTPPPIRPTPPVQPAPRPSPPMQTPPSPTPPAPQACPTGYTSGVIGYNESYGDILLRYNVSYQAFRLSNPSLNPDRLLPGQRFCIPPTGTRGLCSAGSQSYIMNQNETLQSVAQKFNTTPAALLRLNANLAPLDFTPGRVICIG